MAAILEKVRRLKNYLEWRGGEADAVVEMTINKILQRERDQMQVQMNRLQQQLAMFEQQYGWATPAFYDRFERGELGDDMDFIEWSATWEMIQKLQKGLALIA
jgi:hypothetical protein